MTDRLPLFLYGTLRPGCANHRQFDWRGAAFVPAEVCGRLFALPEGYPALLEGNGVVVGELAIFPPATTDAALRELIAQLDRFEGFIGEGCGGNLYERRVIDARTDEGTRLAWVYWHADAARAERVGTHLPRGDWKRVGTVHSKVR